jgi:hypothetical protein
VARGDFALAIDQQRYGHRLHIVQFRDVISANHDRIPHLLLSEKGLHYFPTALVHRDADHGETALFILLLELYVPGDLGLATATPGRPEIEQDNFALIIRQAKRPLLSVRVKSGAVFLSSAGATAALISNTIPAIARVSIVTEFCRGDM